MTFGGAPTGNMHPSAYSQSATTYFSGVVQIAKNTYLMRAASQGK